MDHVTEGNEPLPAGGLAAAGLLPPAGSGLPPGRRFTGLGLTALGLPALTAALVPLRDTLALESVLLLFLLAVVLVGAVGGWATALIAVLGSLLLVNYYFTAPYHTLVVESRDSTIALVVFTLVAGVVGVTVDLAARLRVSVTRSRIEAELLSRAFSAPVEESSPTTILQEIRQTFGLETVALVRGSGPSERTVARVGRPPVEELPGDHTDLRIDIGDGLHLVGRGPTLFGEDREFLRRLAATAGRVWRTRQLAGQAATARRLTEIDRQRTILLAAVGHDLRTPLAGIKAAVTGLRQTDIDLTGEDRDALLATIEDSTDTLDELLSNLLALSRLQAGALSVDLRPVPLDAAVGKALIGLRDTGTVVDVPDDLPPVVADPGLLERVIANLVANACRFSPAGGTVEVRAHVDGRSVRLHVVDRGPGVAEERWETMFEPFQRLDDRSPGMGLGLAIARGFTEAMGATLVPSRTDPEGLTMTLTLPVTP
ncbi:MAG: ATP-binding protein [Actinomycetota bacterium]|nr:ATP-binding protein [Actinomycetota bacterium]